MGRNTMVTPLHSFDFQALQDSFRSLEEVYGHPETERFNRAYQHIYSRLSRHARRRVEECLHVPITGLEHEDWLARIYGVV